MNRNIVVPVVDFSMLGNGKAGREVAGIIDRACRETGFFYLVNHGIPKKDVEQIWAQLAWFFNLPGTGKLVFCRT